MLDLGEVSEARQSVEAAIEGTGADDVATVASTSMVLGLVLEAEGKFGEAESLLRKGLATFEITEYNPWEYELALAEFTLHRGRLEEGNEWLARARASVSRWGPRSPLVGFVERRGGRAAAVGAQNRADD